MFFSVSNVESAHPSLLVRCAYPLFYSGSKGIDISVRQGTWLTLPFPHWGLTSHLCTSGDMAYVAIPPLRVDISSVYIRGHGLHSHSPTEGWHLICFHQGTWLTQPFPHWQLTSHLCASAGGMAYTAILPLRVDISSVYIRGHGLHSHSPSEVDISSVCIRGHGLHSHSPTEGWHLIYVFDICVTHQWMPLFAYPFFCSGSNGHLWMIQMQWISPAAGSS